ncbi:MAG: acyltransferase [Flavipsychrobacter sp.]
MNVQIKSLTATRVIAALLIVVFHYGKELPPFSNYIHFFQQANIAVSYFFVLSGFVMFYSYRNRKVFFKSFIIKRIARIVPVYYLGLILAVLTLVIDHYYYNGNSISSFFRGIILNAGFIQSYFPKYALSINVPAWSLSVEMLFYLMFPLFLHFAQRNKKGFVFFVISFFIVSQIVHHLMVKLLLPANTLEHAHSLVYYNPVFHLNQFLLGMLGVYVYDKFKTENVRVSPLMAFLSIVMLLYFPRSVSIHNGLLAPLFLLLIVVVAIKEPWFLRSRVMVFLGEISYSIYILQVPIYYYTSKWNEEYLNLDKVSFFYLYIVVLLLVSAISYKYVEKPLRKKISSYAK